VQYFAFCLFRIVRISLFVLVAEKTVRRDMAATNVAEDETNVAAVLPGEFETTVIDPQNLRPDRERRELKRSARPARPLHPREGKTPGLSLAPLDASRPPRGGAIRDRTSFQSHEEISATIRRIE
jgi:hypothetical protein